MIKTDLKKWSKTKDGKNYKNFYYQNKGEKTND